MGVEPEQLVQLSVARRDDDDRHCAGAPDRAHDLEAVEAGQAEVEDDEIRVADTGGVQRGRPVAGRHDGEPGVLKVIPGELGDLRFVIDDEHGLHRRSL